MAVEMPDDIAGDLADQLSLYRDSNCTAAKDEDVEHVEDCVCRVHWVPWLVQRMREAVHAEDRLHGLELVRTEERTRLAQHGVRYH